MTKLTLLLDEARQRQNLPSDYAIAKRLNIPTQAVSNWRAGRKYPGLLETFALAEMAGRGADQVLAELELDRATRAGKELQQVAWRERLSKLGAGALGTVILSAGLLGVSFTPDAQARTPSPAPAHDRAALYIMSTARRIWRTLAGLSTPRLALQ